MVVAQHPISPASSLPEESGEERFSGTILVMEDEEGVRYLVQLVLEQAGYQVLMAQDGPRGLEVFRQHGSEVSAVLLDLSMPGMTGLEVLRLLKRQIPQLPVLLMSGYSDSELRKQCSREGVTAFLEKPFVPADLLSALKRIIQP